jgi:hypothetical protein
MKQVRHTGFLNKKKVAFDEKYIAAHRKGGRKLVAVEWSDESHGQGMIGGRMPPYRIDRAVPAVDLAGGSFF